MKRLAEIIGSDEVLQQALGLPSSGDFKFGFKVSIYNWRMRRLRQLRGLTQKQLGEAVGCSKGVVSQIETFKAFPGPDLASKIARRLGCGPEEVFPAWLRFYVLDKSSREFVSTSLELQQAVEKALPHRVKALSAVKPAAVDVPLEAEEEVAGEQLDSTLHEAISTLTPREQKVLILRFGLGGGRAQTLEEVGRVFGVRRERVRQIEVRALRKLRGHRVYRKRLLSFLP